MTISQDKETALRERMERLGLREEEFRETFIRSSGPGGQKVNKTATCVYIVHLPTGLSVKCQQERSQVLNRFIARRLLLDRIEKLRTGLVSAEKARREKVSIGGLVREAVAAYYGIKNKEDKLKALGRLKSLNLPVADYESMEREIIEGALNDKKN